MKPFSFSGLLFLSVFLFCIPAAHAQQANCPGIPGGGTLANQHAAFKAMTIAAIEQREQLLQLPTGTAKNVYAVILGKDGKGCHIAFSGETDGDQHPAARHTAAVIAHTAFMVNGEGGAVSTARTLNRNIVALPVDHVVAYGGQIATRGTPSDQFRTRRLGGIQREAGGLGLYQDGIPVGALGVWGAENECANHNLAHLIRRDLGFSALPAGTERGTDGILYDQHTATPSNIGHPECNESETSLSLAIGAGEKL